MSIRFRWQAGLALLALCVTCAAPADEPDPRIAAEIEATLLRLVELGALKRSEDGRPLLIESEPRVRYELGAVIEFGSGVKEAPVVAITPGGSAEAVGLRVGDLIVAINGRSLADSKDPGSDFARTTMNAGGRFVLQIRRGELEIVLTGATEKVLVPGFRLRIDQPRLP